MAIASFSGLASGIQWADMIDQMMSMESSRRLAPVTNRIALQKQRNTAWSDYDSLVTKLRDSAKTFSDGSAFSAFKTTAPNSPLSGRAVVSAIATDKASPGSYQVEVLALARAEKIGSAEVADVGAALGVAGTFHVNGRAVTMEASNSLSEMRDKVNAVNSGSGASGVTATILTTSAGAHRLILTADATGTRGVELVDSDSGLLQNPALGLLSGSTSSNASTVEAGWTDSIRYSSRSEVLKDVLGVTPPPAVSYIRVGGVQVQIDFNSDTLDSVLAKIQAADPGAKMREEVVNGKTAYRLSTSETVASDAASPESQRVLELLGFSRRGTASQITRGADARFRIDGYDLTRRTNTVSDAIEGVTLDLLAADAGARTSSVTGTRLGIVSDSGIGPAGSHAVQMTTASQPVRGGTGNTSYMQVTDLASAADGTYAVAFNASMQRVSSTSDPRLTVINHADPDTQNGIYDVSITQAATLGSVTGTATAGSYGGPVLGGEYNDYFRIKDEVTGVERDFTIRRGDTVNDVVAGLNAMFTGNNMGVRASNVGGKLRLEHQSYGDAARFRVQTSNGRVNDHYGIANATYKGLDVQGTIGGVAADGVGQMLTSGGGASKGLAVRYTGTSVGMIGQVTVGDQMVVTGGTIGGQAATWDPSSQTLTSNAGTSIAGLGVKYTGVATNGIVGDVTIATTMKDVVTGVTIGGEAATWDASTQTIAGAVGSRFEGIELSYTGALVNGKAGDFVVEGDASVEVKVARDAEATQTKAQEFVDLYNEMVGFVKRQRDTKGALASDGSLRAMMGSVRDVLLADPTGLSSTNSYKRLTLAGIEFTREGELKLDADALSTALATAPTDVAELFASVGSMLEEAAGSVVDDVDGSITLHQDALSSSISTLEQRKLDIEAALERQRVAMEAQYTAMEVALSSLQSQGSWLTSQFSSLGRS